MAKFTLHVLRGSSVNLLSYDNLNSELLYQDGTPVVPVEHKQGVGWGPAEAVSVSTPGRKSGIRVLKVSLGLSCNYACGYCSQRFVPHADSTNPDDVDAFVQMLRSAEVRPERVEFWGGEPLVYWKTLKPLAERLCSEFPDAAFGMVTNGSLLDAEKIEWIDRMGFAVGLSHDGPGYHVRGKDPLDDPQQRQAIADLYHRLHPQGRISINAMLHRHNRSRAAVQRWLQERFGVDVAIGEGALIDPYDSGGLDATLRDDDELVAFRKAAFFELRSGAASSFNVAQQKVSGFIRSVQQGHRAETLGQKCGMDRQDTLAVDLLGNVVTCQNVSAAATAPNGEPHRIGHLSDLAEVAMRTATHWSQRQDCPGCPVLHLCKGACMFLEGPLWDAGCESAYSDNVAFLAAALQQLTGMTLVRIEAEHLPERRQALWVTPATTRQKIIPITAIG
jgi:uncharacterized protein